MTVSPAPPVSVWDNVCVRVQAFPPLVQCDLGQIGAQFHLTRIRRLLACEQVQQCGLAGAIAADNADPVAANDAGREIPHHDAIAVGFGHVLGHRDQPPGQVRLGCFQLDLAQGAALLLVLLAQRMQVAKPLLVALAARCHAVAQPVLLHHDLAPKLVALGFFLFQDLVAPGFEMGEALFQDPGHAAVQPDGGA